MNLRQIVKTLREQGHRVGYKVRKDGSIRITSIDGRKYSPRLSEGNRAARSMAGGRLSERKERQLEKGRKTHATNVAKRRKPRPKKLSDRVLKELRKAQRAIRQAGEGKGTVTARNVRYNLDQYGEEETLRRLRKTTRYYQGFAYEENVRALSDRIMADAHKVGSVSLLALAGKVWERRETFLEKWIEPSLEVLYTLEVSVQGLADQYQKEQGDICAATLKSIYGW